ncbi:hypothetical protein H8I69_04970 [Serratia fonticola]|uniref:hypothetical protein n=1 Tax=Serratia fonticola TaxID=47917 RepID=UPI000BA2AF4E|nr:hypothetical protein [Serratia fonticola]MBC3378469.1 hypothetical protein [Serratia fonticola]NYA37669.1 hypothetical protein [Serratia fonticola]PAA97743.1 hypothetical protein CJJ13_08950 [Serratia fonticola]CAI0891206.1 Uncharacterised protein [Serratia fonticola]
MTFITGMGGILHHLRRWYLLREAVRTWQDRGELRAYAIKRGWLTKWQRQNFGRDYYGVKQLARRAMKGAKWNTV